MCTTVPTSPATSPSAGTAVTKTTRSCSRIIASWLLFFRIRRHQTRRLGAGVNNPHHPHDGCPATRRLQHTVYNILLPVGRCHAFCHRKITRHLTQGFSQRLPFLVPEAQGGEEFGLAGSLRMRWRQQ